MPYGCMYRTSQGAFLSAGRDGSVSVKDEKGEVAKSLTASYNELHGRDYQWSMSATMNWLQFNPVEVTLPDTIEELKDLLVLKDGNPVLMKLGSVAGHTRGWLVKPEAAEKLAAEGTEPRLISQDAR